MNDLKELMPGCGRPLIIAGPCSAESRGQVLATARGVSEAGCRIFRAGVWKPRTKPGCFEGIGAPALSWLAEVKESTAMAVATEVATREHTLAALEAGIDVLWIGARTSANPFAVQDIADVLASLSPERLDSLCVLVKNPVNPDLELWIGALQRIYNAGVRRLGAIHRGYSTYGEHIYRNPPLWRIPIELHRRLPALPIICDPSHIGGRRDFIAPLSRQALDMNFDGLMIECHCNPDQALSDASQQITPDELRRLLPELRPRGECPEHDSLAALRRQVDEIDSELIELLARRMAVTDEIGRFKREHAMSIVQAERYDRLIRCRGLQAADIGLDPEFVKSILTVIHEESVRRQVDISTE